jgi:LmbE family N-acetylglucosaminyl deacetylase
VSFTVVFFHAHPDDEALYTGGTMARLAAEGNRVVLVTATRGEAGLAAADLTGAEPLGDIRERELASSASALGCARLVQLGYPDSGMAGGSWGGFSTLDPREPASRLAGILREEEADALVTYDENGGYGHPDHRQVHRVGAIAARTSETAVEFHATVDRDLLGRALLLARAARRAPDDLGPDRFTHAYSPRRVITHRVDVRGYLSQKRSALEAHRSQATGGEVDRTVGWLLSLPGPLFRVVLGREWFIEGGRHPGRRPLDDLLASLRPH